MEEEEDDEPLPPPKKRSKTEALSESADGVNVVKVRMLVNTEQY